MSTFLMGANNHKLAPTSAPRGKLMIFDHAHSGCIGALAINKVSDIQQNPLWKIYHNGINGSLQSNTATAGIVIIFAIGM